MYKKFLPSLLFVFFPLIASANGSISGNDFVKLVLISSLILLIPPFVTFLFRKILHKMTARIILATIVFVLLLLATYGTLVYIESQTQTPLQDIEVRFAPPKSNFLSAFGEIIFLFTLWFPVVPTLIILFIVFYTLVYIVFRLFGHPFLYTKTVFFESFLVFVLTAIILLAFSLISTRGL